MLQRHGNVENLTGNYVFVLGLYRGFYLLNWIYRYVAEQHVTDTIVWVCGTIQTLLYVDFFYCAPSAELLAPRPLTRTIGRLRSGAAHGLQVGVAAMM